MSDEGFTPRCDKCGAEITTGLMAAFCPAGKDCEFWCQELEEFLSYPGVVVVPIAPAKEG